MLTLPLAVETNQAVGGGAHDDPRTLVDVLHVQGVTKSFGRTVAVDQLSFSLASGEIVALLGENGAGKSTIIGVLAGLFGQDYEGTLNLAGAPYHPTTVADAERHGIVMIAQEINVVADLSVAQTLFLNQEPTRWGLIDGSAMRSAARQLLGDLGIDVDEDTRMGSLDLARQQLVMIARALRREARILVLDEPTAALTGDEVERLFERLRAFRDSGTTCLFVSHRLAEVFTIADRILVMRDGSLVGDHRTASSGRHQVVEEMLGVRAPRVASQLAVRDVAGRSLRVRHLSVASPRSGGRPLVDDVSLDVAAGEVVGLFGLVGSGAGVVGKAVFGAWRGPVTATLEVDDRAVLVRSPEEAIGHGIGYVSQDRRDALVGIHSVAENITVAGLARFRRGPFLDAACVRTESRARIRQLAIRTRDETSALATLSGGNQQKVQVARWLVADTPILILDDPTRGVDVGARAEIHAILGELAASGRTLLLVSSDTNELLGVCSRILVMRDGRLVCELVAAETTEAELLGIAAGVVGDPSAEGAR